MNVTRNFYRFFIDIHKQELVRKFCSAISLKVAKVEYVNGLPQFTVPLPSRNENCLFVLCPISQSIGDLIEAIRREDLGVDHVSIYKTDGLRYSKSNSIYSLLTNDFDIVINNTTYHVSSSIPAVTLEENITKLSEVKNLISQLNTVMNSTDFCIVKERELKQKAEELEKELQPLEEKRMEIALRAARHTRRLTWLGLGAMGLQFGLLARLTWWEYSWDIMEPVTYFVGYGTSIAMFAYYVVTRQEYCFPHVFDREYLKKFYKVSHNISFDIEKYNKLRDDLAQIQTDIKRLRDPLLLNLPLQQQDKRLVYTYENKTNY